MSSRPPAERRRNRKRITEVDQEFIDHVRATFSAHAARRDRLGPAGVRSLLGVTSAAVARRIVSLFDTTGSGSVDPDEFRDAVIALVLGSDQAKLEFAFDVNDQDGDGSIRRRDLTTMIDAASRASRIRLAAGQRRALLRALFEHGDRDRDGGISLTEFRALLRRFPVVRNEMLKSVSTWFGFTSGGAVQPPRQLAGALRTVFIILPALVYRHLLLIGYVALNVYLFEGAASRYAAEGANLYVQVARGAGACLNLNAALVVVPMMRTLLTAVRRSFLGRLIPVDQSIAIHRVVGHAVFAFAVLHTAAHVLNYTTLELPLEQSLLGTAAGLSGLVTMAALFIMWFFALGFLRRGGWFQAFAVTHLLYVGFFAALLLHGPSFWRWAWTPLAGFALELLLKRLYKRRHSLVSRARILPHGVTQLELQRPPQFVFQPGDYIFLKLPAISRFEWHPFTLSSGPEEDHLGVHIRSLGNWTRAVHGHFSGLRGRAQQTPALLNGPYGTPSARIFRARYAILIGAGIGVTPFASILKSLLYRREHGGQSNLERVYFFWLNRGRRSFRWFADLLAEIEALRLERFLSLNIYMTDVKLDPALGLVKVGMDLLGGQAEHDVTTGLRTITNFGRPDWPTIFADVSRRHGLRSVNVFFCGPHALGASIRDAARRYGFRFRNEVF